MIMGSWIDRTHSPITIVYPDNASETLPVANHPSSENRAPEKKGSIGFYLSSTNSTPIWVTAPADTLLQDDSRVILKI